MTLLAHTPAVIQSWMLGVIIGLVASLGARSMAPRLAVVAGILCVVGCLIGPWPVLGGVFLGVLAYGSARMAQRGIDGALMVISAIVGVATFTRPQFLESAVGGVSLADGTTWLNAALVGLTIAGSALWTTFMWRVLARGLPSSAARPVSSAVARRFALVAGVLVTVAAILGLAMLPPRAGGWVIVTLAVVLRPSVGDTRDRALSRVGGTTVGVVIAAIIAWVIPWPLAAVIIGQLLLVVALVVRLDGKVPYWVYAAFVAQVIVLSDPVHAAAAVQQRLGATLIGGALALTAAATMGWWLERQRSGEDASGVEQPL